MLASSWCSVLCMCIGLVMYRSRHVSMWLRLRAFLCAAVARRLCRGVIAARSAPTWRRPGSCLPCNQKDKVTLSVLARAQQNGGVSTPVGCWRPSSRTRTADSQLMPWVQHMSCRTARGPMHPRCWDGTRKRSAGGSWTIQVGHVWLSHISSSLLCRPAHVQEREPGGFAPVLRRALGFRV